MAVARQPAGSVSHGAAVGSGAEGLGFCRELKRTGIFMTRPSDRQAGRQV